MVRSTPKLVVIAWGSNYGLRFIHTDGRKLPPLREVQPWWYGFCLTFATYAAFFRLANRFPRITGVAVAIAAIVAISLGPYTPARRSESR